MIGTALIEEIRSDEPSNKIWQEAINLSELIKSNYEAVLSATLEALSHARHPDTVAALSTCLIEHLFEYDFSSFDKLEKNIREGDDKSLYALSLCSKFGSSTNRDNVNRWNSVLTEYRGRLESYKMVQGN